MLSDAFVTENCDYRNALLFYLVSRLYSLWSIGGKCALFSRDGRTCGDIHVTAESSVTW
jgi:hypothetical protein